MNSKELFTIGQVVAPHGVRGELRVLPLTDFPERFIKTKHVYVCKDEKVQLRSVLQSRLHKNIVILKLDECETVEDAELLRGAKLKVNEAELVPLPPGHYYVHQICGLSVYTLEGERIGIVSDILETGANDVYVVSPDTEISSPRQILIPALKEVIKEIDLQGGKILIDPIPGLLER